MSEVFLCKIGQLSARSRTDLRKAGVVVVEVEDPAACTFIRASEVVSASDMVWAALDAVNFVGEYGSKGGEQRRKFASNVLQVVLDAREGTVP